MFNIYCIGAGVLGLLLGYVFAWSSKASDPKPSGNEIAGLLGTVLGGAALQLLNQIDCPERLPIYIIGVALGYLLYLVLLNFKWPLVQHLVDQHGLRQSPLLPWRAKDPCCNCHQAPDPNNHPNNPNQPPRN